MDPSITFYDRRGNIVTPDARSFIKPRRGVFALAVAIGDRAIMLAAEACAPDVPELPGGGIEDGEFLANDASAHRHNLAVVALPGTLRGIWVMADSGTDPRHFVCCNGNPDARAAHENATVVFA